MKRIGLRDARHRAKLTQADLAARIGKPQSYISKLENGQLPEPSFSDVVALARELAVDPARLKFERIDEAIAS